MSTVEDARKAQETVKALMSNVNGYNGCGIIKTDDGFGVKVNVETSEAGQHVPTQIDGVVVKTDVVGQIVCLEDDWG